MARKTSNSVIEKILENFEDSNLSDLENSESEEILKDLFEAFDNNETFVMEELSRQGPYDISITNINGECNDELVLDENGSSSEAGIKDPNLERHTKGKSRHFTVNGFNTHAQQQQQSQQQSQSDVRNIYNNPYIPPSAPTSTPNQQQQQQTHRLQQQQQQQLLYKSIASGVVGGVGNSGANQYDYPPTTSTELQHQQQLQQQQLQQHQQLQLQQQQQQLSSVLEAENSTFPSHNKV
ncbi:uncharacterized protein DDB_G0285291 [Anastrepha ludens]|uniref:uncharacterized protein DDB_G0285291 n=1 Tax=Anastrepha ludens TaxID=28586 RepID=UPI0023AF0328|nr:uncharacterized protein DDB_G0285291 [Anastrepha ludens]